MTDAITATDDKGGWVALLPVTLTNREKQTLEWISRLGVMVDLDALTALEEHQLIARRDFGVRVYELTETGKLWLQRCIEFPHELTDMTALVGFFDALDDEVKWCFTAWVVALATGMKLCIPEAEGERVTLEPFFTGKLDQCWPRPITSGPKLRRPGAED